MRILLNRRDESGAVAVLVGVLALFLLGTCGIVADVGLAYANKRQMQTAADAAALAAAGEFAEYAGDCAALNVSGSAPYIAAELEASNKMGQNSFLSAPATSQNYAVACEASGLVVRTQATTDSPSVFGQLFGLDDYQVNTSAAAVLDVPEEVLNLRPIAICSKDLAAYTGSSPSKVLKLSQPGNGGVSSSCDDSEAVGNWWTINCPEDGSSSDLANNIENGCDDPVSVVPGQPTLSSPPTAAEAAALSTYLRSKCPVKSGTCLGGDTGNDMGNTGTVNAFLSLMNSGETVPLPVFCASPSCVPGTVTGTGNGAIYPVHRFVSVRMCGYHWANKNSTAAMMTGECGPANNPDGLDPATGSNQHNYILGVVKLVQVSGTTGSSTCRIGILSCDTGLRRVRLLE